MRGTIPERLVRVVFTTFLALPAVAKSSPDAGGLPMADPVAIVKQLHAAKAYVRVYTFSGGKIVRVRNYYDTAAYVDALRTGP